MTSIIKLDACRLCTGSPTSSGRHKLQQELWSVSMIILVVVVQVTRMLLPFKSFAAMSYAILQAYGKIDSFAG